MTAAQNARAAKAVEFVRWLRESARDMHAEGDPGGAMHAARLGVAIAKLFGEEGAALAGRGAPPVELDEIEPTRRATFAGLAPDEEE